MLTGGQVITSDLGLELKDATMQMLGTARQVKVTKENTIIVDGAGNSEDIKARVGQIRTAIEASTSDFDREKLQERLAKMAGGVAVVKVGAATETEMKEKKLRIETLWLRPSCRRRGYRCRRRCGTDQHHSRCGEAAGYR